jgi:hypothetical protein
MTTIPFTFTGLLHGNTVFTTAGTVPYTFGNFATVSNPNEADVIDTLQVPSISNPVGLDNIVVVAAVPDPATRQIRASLR